MWRMVVCLGAMLALPATAAQKLRVEYVNFAEDLPLFVAQDEAIFARHGLDVALTPVPNSAIAIALLVAGREDISFSIPSTIFQARDAGIAAVIIAGCDSFRGSQNPISGLVARSGSNLHTASDLVGHRIAIVAVGAGNHYMLLRQWLAKNGVEFDRVTLVETPFAQMSDALHGGTVDAAVVSEPFYSRILASGTATRMDDIYAVMPLGTTLSFFMARADWPPGHRAEIAAFRASLSDAIDDIQAHDANARAILAHWTHLPPEAATRAPLPNFTPDVTAQGLRFWIDLARQQGLIDRDYDPADFLWTK